MFIIREYRTKQMIGPMMRSGKTTELGRVLILYIPQNKKHLIFLTIFYIMMIFIDESVWFRPSYRMLYRKMQWLQISITNYREIRPEDDRFWSCLPFGIIYYQVMSSILWFERVVSMLEFPDDISLKTCSNETIIQFVPLVQSIRSHGLVSSELLHATYARRDLSPVQSIHYF